MVYCVNQGLYSTNFGLVNFFVDAKCNQIDSSNPHLRDLLVLFLRFVKADDDKRLVEVFLNESTSLPKIIQKFVLSDNKNYTFNPVVF